MFMLSYIFVIVCYLLSEVNVCRIFLWFIYICILVENPIIKDHIGGLMVSVRTTNAVYWVWAMVRSNKRLALALAASPCNERSIKG